MVSKISICNFLSWRSAAPGKPAPFSLSEFLQKNPIPEGTRFPMAHRTWIVLSKGSPSSKDPGINQFFENVENFCKHNFSPELLKATKQQLRGLIWKSANNPQPISEAIGAVLQQLNGQPDPELEKLVLFLKTEQNKLDANHKPATTLSLLQTITSAILLAGIAICWHGLLSRGTISSAPLSSLCPLVPAEAYLRPSYFADDFSATLAMDRLNYELERDNLNGALNIAPTFKQFDASLPVYATIANKQIEKKDFEGAAKTFDAIPFKWKYEWDFYNCFREPIERSFFEFHLEQKNFEKAVQYAWTSQECKKLVSACLQEGNPETARKILDHSRSRLHNPSVLEPLRKFVFVSYLNQKDLPLASKYAKEPQEHAQLGKARLLEENLEMSRKTLYSIYSYSSFDERASLLIAIVEKALEKKEFPFMIDALQSFIGPAKPSGIDEREMQLLSTTINKMSDADFVQLKAEFETLFMRLSPPNQKAFSETFIHRYRTIGDGATVARIQKHLSNLDRHTFVLPEPRLFRDFDLPAKSKWVVFEREKLKSVLEKTHPEALSQAVTPFPDRGELVWLNATVLSGLSLDPNCLQNWPSKTAAITLQEDA